MMPQSFFVCTVNLLLSYCKAQNCQEKKSKNKNNFTKKFKSKKSSLKKCFILKSSNSDSNEIYNHNNQRMMLEEHPLV